MIFPGGIDKHKCVNIYIKHNQFADMAHHFTNGSAMTPQDLKICPFIPEYQKTQLTKSLHYLLADNGKER
jgi:hypothetical protein